MSFRRYTQELYDRPKARLLHLKVRMVKSGVIEAHLYGCATCTTSSVYNIPKDVASNPRSLVQVAKQLHPLLQRRLPANRI